MKLALALILALILMDYAAAAPWKQPSSYVPNKASLELGHEQVQEMEGYLEAGQNQNIQSNPENDHGLQQQNKGQEIYYPTAVMSDKRQSSINLIMDPSMTTGAAEAVFKSPASNVIWLRLFNARNDVLLYVGARVYFHTQTLALNSQTAGGDYGEWVYPEGFPFPCCGYVTIITLRVDIAPKAFIISVNGLELANFPFRPELGPPVDRIRFDAHQSGAELISLTAEY